MKNNDARQPKPCDQDEYTSNSLTRIDWRASLVPAAVVTPTPVAYLKIVAFEKLAVRI